MAKDNEWNRLRDEERSIETKAAFAGGGDSSEGGNEQYMYPTLESVDDEAVAKRVANGADDPGGESGPATGSESAPGY